MSDDEFDSVVRVHLRGHFVNMRNATAYWRDKAKGGDEVYGRLISTSSEAAFLRLRRPAQLRCSQGGHHRHDHGRRPVTDQIRHHL